jgi:hypothetical protein
VPALRLALDRIRQRRDALIYARKDELVACPECGVPIYRLTRDVGPQTPISASLFAPLGEMPELVDNAPPPLCPNGHHWFARWVANPRKAARDAIYAWR